MPQEALDKGMSFEFQGLELIALLPIAESKADQPISDIHDAVVGDGDAMRVAPDILDDLLGSFEGSLGVDHPVFVIELIDEL